MAGQEANCGQKGSRAPPTNNQAEESLTLNTMNNIRRRHPPKDGSFRCMMDNTAPEYTWLLPGWLAEERTMAHGRVYRYYYDPSGKMYRTREEVLRAWEESGLVLIDD